MRILVVSTSVVPLGSGRYGGIELLCSTFVEGLVKAGQDVTVGAPQGSRVPDGAELIETVPVPQEQDNDGYAATAIHRQTDLYSFDIIHDFSHGHEVTRRGKNLPTVNMLWDPVTHHYEKASYNIVCLSQWQRQRFEKAYNQRAIVMPMCVNTEKYHPIPSPRRERFLFLGKISPEKGVHLAIEYCRELNLPLDVVGGLIPSEQDSPYLRSVQKWCNGDKLRLFFNVNEELKLDFLQNAKAVIYPVQQDEAHWLAGMEAWCCGVPTLTYGMGAMEEVCPPRDTVVEVGRHGEFMRRMVEMTAVDAVQWTKDAVQKFGTENVIPQWLDLYKRVAEGQRWR